MPALQDKQREDRADEKEPAGQVPLVAVRPMVEQKLPSGHAVAADIAGEGQKLPAGQRVQDAEAAPPEE